MSDTTDRPLIAERADFDTPDTPDNIITIGDLQLRRVHYQERRLRDACAHHRLSMDDEGGIVRCRDCGVQVTAYWALTFLASQYKRARARVAADQERVAEESKKYVILRAAKAVEQAWRGGMAPTCPHCHLAVLPEDGMGSSTMNVDFERKKRARRDAEWRELSADAAMEKLTSRLRAGHVIVGATHYSKMAITVSPCGTGFYALGEVHPHTTPEAAILAACDRWGVGVDRFRCIEIREGTSGEGF